MSSYQWELLPPAFREILTEQDLQRNSTLQSFDRLTGQLERIESVTDSINSILDIGCNRGGFAAALGDHIDADIVYGIDTDPDAREHARRRGLETFDVNVEGDQFPLESNSVDLVLCFGLVEHLTYFDNLFSETTRVLDDGFFWITSPNLGSWLNRIALLTGHQPRNIEISREIAAGSLPVYNKDEFLDHIHAPTYRCLVELLEYYNFEPIETAALTPYQRSWFDALIDRIFSVRVAWSRRVSILARQIPE